VLLAGQRTNAAPPWLPTRWAPACPGWAQITSMMRRHLTHPDGSLVPAAKQRWMLSLPAGQPPRRSARPVTPPASRL